MIKPRTAPGERIVRVIYRALIALYPRHFRRRYRRELIATFYALSASHRKRGRLPLWGFWFHALSDFILSAARMRALSFRRVLAREALARNQPTSEGENSMDNLMRDLRYTVRSWSRTPAYIVGSILTLAAACS